jgi:AraC family transcriptional regulator, transcriptional activator of pobA
MDKRHTSGLLMEQEIKDSFHIKFLNDKKFRDPAVYRLYYHRILFIKEGKGALHIDDRFFQLSGNQLFLLAKSQTVSFQPGSSLSGYQLSFGDCFWEKAPASASNCKAVLFNNVTTNQQLPVAETDHDELVLLFNALYLEFGKGDYINKLDALAAYLKIIMIKIANINASLILAYDSPDHQLYRQFLELVNTHYRTIRDVADYAGRLNISPRKLSDVCKENGGKGAKEIINSQIVAEAKRFLQFSSKPVKEIAFELNFGTPEQFSHFFKTHARVSPLLYRETFVNIGR